MLNAKLIVLLYYVNSTSMVSRKQEVDLLSKRDQAGNTEIHENISNVSFRPGLNFSISCLTPFASRSLRPIVISLLVRNPIECYNPFFDCTRYSVPMQIGRGK